MSVMFSYLENKLSEEKNKKEKTTNQTLSDL